MLRVEGLSIELGDFRLRDASFTVGRGNYFVLLGASGAGKTVLLELIAGLVRPTTGRVLLAGADITPWPVQRRNIGLVYQDHALFPHLSVGRNIAYPLRGRTGDVHARVLDLARLVGAEQLLNRLPETLSQGEAQRVALARALATRPQLLLLDEPLASLDVQATAGIRALLRRLNTQGQTVVHVTHDYEEAVALASHIAVLEGGRISHCGTRDDVLDRPQSSFMAGFVGIRNFFEGTLLRNNGEEAEFVTAHLRFHVATRARHGTGYFLLRSQDVVISSIEPEGIVRNRFSGSVVDVEPAQSGLEVTVEVQGLRFFALIANQSARQLALAPGQSVWIGWKPTAARFIPGTAKGALA